MRDTRFALFVSDQLLAASTNAVPSFDEESNKQFDSSPSWGSPSARIEAARGLMLVARLPELCTSEVVAAIRALSRDGSNAVRYMVADCLRFVSRTQPLLFWEIADRIAAIEQSHPILVAFISNCLSNLPEHGERSAVLIATIFERIDVSESSRDAGHTCLQFFLRRYVHTGHTLYRQHLFKSLEDLNRHAEHLVVVAGSLRNVLLLRQQKSSDSVEPFMTRRAWEVLGSLTTTSVDAWVTIEDAIKRERQASSSWQQPDSEREFQHAIFRILDGISRELYFASGAHDDKNNKDRVITSKSHAHVEFLEYAEPLVCNLARVGHPSVTHHLVEFLEAFVAVQPERVFRLIAAVVLEAEKGGYQYEPLAADIVVRLVERYLADYPYVFRESTEHQDRLVDVLDIFVSWPTARKLTYRLGDIYQ